MIFDLWSFDVQIWCLVFRLSVPFGLRSFGLRSFGLRSFGLRSFGLRSFGLGSLFGLGSNSTFCLLTFCHSTFCLLAFGHSTFCHSTFCLSTLCRWIVWTTFEELQFVVSWVLCSPLQFRTSQIAFAQQIFLSGTSTCKSQYHKHTVDDCYAESILLQFWATLICTSLCKSAISSLTLALSIWLRLTLPAKALAQCNLYSGSVLKLC